MFRYIINETGLGIFARFRYKETLFTVISFFLKTYFVLRWQLALSKN